MPFCPCCRPLPSAGASQPSVPRLRVLRSGPGALRALRRGLRPASGSGRVFSSCPKFLRRSRSPAGPRNRRGCRSSRRRRGRRGPALFRHAFAPGQRILVLALRDVQRPSRGVADEQGLRATVPSSALRRAGLRLLRGTRVGRTRMPSYIRLADQRPMLRAGAWDRWSDPETGDASIGFAVVTTAAHRNLAFIHDRQPLMLSFQDACGWMDRDTPIPVEAH